jgi:hypothetical protein
VAEVTIRRWLSRSGPKDHPFPSPEVRYGRRNYWQKSTADKWNAEQRRLNAKYRSSQGQSRPQ